MITLDPIALMIKGDSHKNVENGPATFRRPVRQPRRRGLGVHHFTKNTAGGDPLDRISGSLAFGALPRCVWVAAKDLNAGMDARRILMRAKMSNGPDWGGFEYSLDRRELDGCPGIEAQCALWGDVLEGTASELLAQLESKPDREGPPVVFLREALKDGPQMAAEVIARGEAEGLNERELRRAFKKMAA